jgi:hypothetical protein
MTNFKSAFQVGLKAAQKAEAAKKEIKEVFNDLNKQLSEASDGKLIIEIQQLTRPLPLPFNLVQQGEKYWAIVARNPKLKASPIKELAEWQIDRHGYPCKITWSGIEEYCEKKQAVETGLEHLLQDPTTAEKLQSLVNTSDMVKI